MTIPIIRPRTPEDALLMRRSLGERARYIAGGTALQLAWPEGRADHPLVDLSGLDAGPLMRIEDDGAVTLSAFATLETLRRHAGLATRLPVLPEAIGAIAAWGVRELATLGGNIAWRAGDLVPLLLALDASVTGLDGDVALCDWLAEPGEDLLLSVTVPALSEGTRVIFEKVGRRAAFSPSLVTVAAVTGPAGTRIAVGGGPVPPSLAALPAGAMLSQEALAALFALPADDFLSGPARSRLAARVLAGHLARDPRAS
ncbi:FAD binding domain-containing protein [Segnochrobactraceae bacterium EtOH-i3]